MKKSLAITMLGSVCLLNGCLESSFQLSSESRLPVWIHLPPTVKREDVSLTMNYYTMPFGPDTDFVLQNKQGDVLQEAKGNEKPLDHAYSRKYPHYNLITVNGVSELIEHKKMEPIFYVSDDPSLKPK